MSLSSSSSSISLARHWRLGGYYFLLPPSLPSLLHNIATSTSFSSSVPFSDMIIMIITVLLLLLYEEEVEEEDEQGHHLDVGACYTAHWGPLRFPHVIVSLPPPSSFIRSLFPYFYVCLQTYARTHARRDLLMCVIDPIQRHLSIYRRYSPSSPSCHCHARERGRDTDSSSSNRRRRWWRGRRRRRRLFSQSNDPRFPKTHSTAEKEEEEGPDGPSPADDNCHPTNTRRRNRPT